ncbi:MAG: HD domain-containing protein [Candidatus Paceibacterota bacterium]|jgi:(p)ppGpp synthase/HD superfamily hydrolase
MIFTPKIQKAIDVSALAHRDFKRVGLDLPYVVHPFAVMLILSQYTENEDLLCAALLHDTVEDNFSYSIDYLTREFGQGVADLVDSVTEKRTADASGCFKESWQERKAGYLARLSSATEGAVLISAADTIQNLDSLVATYEKCGPQIWKKFGASIERKLSYYRQIEAIVKVKTTCRIQDDLTCSLRRLESVLAAPLSSRVFTESLLRQSDVNSV